MSRYTVVSTGGVFDTEVSAVVRVGDPGWDDYVRWLEQGNEPDPAPKPPEPTLEERRAAVLAQVNGVRDEAMALGVAWGGHTWDSDSRSQSNLTGAVSAVTAGVPLPPGFTWRSADNQNVPMLPAQLVELGAYMMAFVNGVYEKSWALKAEIAASTTPEAIDLRAGWPTPFPVPPAPPKKPEDMV